MKRAESLILDWIKGKLEKAINQARKQFVLIIGPEERVVRCDDRFTIWGPVVVMDQCFESLRATAHQGGLLGQFHRSVQENGAIGWRIVFGQNPNQDLMGELNSLIEKGQG